MAESPSRAMLVTEVDAAELTAQIVARVVAELTAIVSAPQTERLVTQPELADIVGLSESSIARLRADGVIPSIRAGSRRLYRPSAVIAALEATRDGEDES